MQQAVLAGKDFHESTERLNRLDNPVIDLAHFRHGGKGLDAIQHHIHAFLVASGNVHDAELAHFLDRDFATAFTLHFLDNLATGSDNRTDEFARNPNLDDTRSMRLVIGTRSRHHFEHLAQDMGTAAMRLRQSLGQDFIRKTVNLYIHLASSDAIGRTANLEVHIAQMVLIAQNIGKNRVIACLGVGNQAHRDTAHRLADLHPGIHQRQAAGANRSHRRRAVRFEDIRNHPDRVRTLVLGRQHLLQGTHSQVAMTDFTAPGTPHRLHLTGSKRREVVVQQEAVGTFHNRPVDSLLVQFGAQCHRAQRLGLATGEDSRTVRTGQHIHFAPDRTDVFQTTAIQTDTFLENHIAHGFAVYIVEITANHEFLACQGFRREVLFDESLLDFINLLRAELLVGHAFASAVVALLIALLMNQSPDGFIVHFMAVFPLGLAHFLGQLHLHLALHLDSFMRGLEGFHHHFLAHFLHLAFHHRNIVDRGTDHQFQVGFFHLRNRRVDHELAVHAGHTHFGNRAVERNVRNGQSSRSGQSGKRIRQVFLVSRNQVNQHLGIGMIVIGEQRPQSAVDQTGNKNFVFRQTGFTLEETARKTAYRIVFFLIVNREGHEIHILPYLGLAADSGEQHRVAAPHNGRTIGLLGNLASFNHNFPAIGQVESFLST